MQSYTLCQEQLEAFRQNLLQEERSANTVEKYLRDTRAFFAWLAPDKQVSKEVVIAYKAHLAARYKGSSANSMLAAVNALLAFLGWGECRVRQLRVQRQNFRRAERELTKAEYQRLLNAAQSRKNRRLYLLMQTICGTGLRVSEHRFVTVEALRRGSVRVRSKGKERLVFLPPALVKQLLAYCDRQGVQSGPVFVTRSGNPLNRSNIWAAMKKLCVAAKVDARKVFPHNLRHLFALTYYRAQRDLLRLADLLGHSSIETTRIYTATSGAEQQRQVARLGLVSEEWAG